MNNFTAGRAASVGGRYSGPYKSRPIHVHIPHQMKTAVASSVTTLVAALALSGCASIISGSQQSISVSAKTPDSVDVAGASCSFENGKGKWFAPAPGSVTVNRAYSALIVHCDHPDWTGDTEAKSTTKAMAFGNIIFGGVIGAGVDIGTGAAYDYPQLITVPMKSRVAASAPAPAAGATPVLPATPVPDSAAAPATVRAPATQPAPVAALAAPVPTVAPVPPTPVPLATPVATTGGTATTATPTAAPLTMPIAPQPTTTSVGPPQAMRPAAIGKDGFTASRLARDAACHTTPDPVLVAKGPGFESYSVACVNGDALAIRCEFGNCRVLR